MTAIKLFDKVRLTRGIPEAHLKAGMEGWVVEILDDTHYEVEFSDAQGATLYIGAFEADALEACES